MNEIHQELPQDQPAVYRIQVDGRIDQRRLDWFDDMTISSENRADGKAISTLVGSLADQAALHGLLSRIYSLGYLVVSVTRLEEPA